MTMLHFIWRLVAGSCIVGQMQNEPTHSGWVNGIYDMCHSTGETNGSSGFLPQGPLE
jgi:hypothetical protein